MSKPLESSAEMQTRILDAAYAQQKRMEAASPQATRPMMCTQAGCSFTCDTYQQMSEHIDEHFKSALTDEKYLAESVKIAAQFDRAAQPAAGTTPPCKHCGLKLYWDTTYPLGARWRHHGSNFTDCGEVGSMKSAEPAEPSEGTTPQAERPKYRDVACKYCHRLRVQQSGICEKCQWDNDLGNFASITGRCSHSSDGKHKPVPGNNIMGAAFMECELCKVELPKARAVAPVETPPMRGDAGATSQGHTSLVPDECRFDSDSPANPVATRLTAEQFRQAHPAMKNARVSAENEFWTDERAEAFRDKSEAGLLERIEQLMDAVSELNSFDVPKALVDERMANAGLREEIERLRAWKKSQMAVTPDWQEIGELLNIGLGQSVTENIIPAITELRAKLAEQERQWQSWCIIEIAVRNPNVAEYCKHWEGRAEAAEAELAALREALQPFSDPADYPIIMGACWYCKEKDEESHKATCPLVVAEKALSAAPEAKS